MWPPRCQVGRGSQLLSQWIKKGGLAIDNGLRNARLHKLTTQDETAMLSAQERDAIFTEFIEHRNRKKTP